MPPLLRGAIATRRNGSISTARRTLITNSVPPIYFALAVQQLRRCT